MPANSNRIIQSSILKETKTKPKQVLVHTLFSGLRRARSLDVISYSIEKEIFPKLPHLRWDNFEHILVLF